VGGGYARGWLFQVIPTKGPNVLGWQRLAQQGMSLSGGAGGSRSRAPAAGVPLTQGGLESCRADGKWGAKIERCTFSGLRFAVISSKARSCLRLP